MRHDEKVVQQFQSKGPESEIVLGFCIFYYIKTSREISVQKAQAQNQNLNFGPSGSTALKRDKTALEITARVQQNI